MFEEALVNGMRTAWPLLAVAVLGMVAVLLLEFYRRAPRKLPLKFPYQRRPALFTEAEARFLQALRETVPTMDVFGKVRLEDVIVGSPV